MGYGLVQLTTKLKEFGSGKVLELFLITLIGTSHNQIILEWKIASGCGKMLKNGMIGGVIMMEVYQKHCVKFYLNVHLKISFSMQFV